MKREISSTTIAVVVGIVVVILVFGAWWMWRQPAGAGAPEAPPGTPQAAAQMKSRGQQMKNDFMAAHRHGGQAGEASAGTSGK